MKLIPVLILTFILALPVQAQAVQRAPLETVLRQHSVPVSQVRLDEIADSLVRDVIRPRPNETDSVHRQRAFSVIAVLTAAGSSEPSRLGTPYIRAIDKLIQIHREIPALTSGGVLGPMLRVVGRARALAYHREVLISPSEQAYKAYLLLTWEATYRSASDAAGALTVLCEVQSGSLATDPRVIIHLQGFTAGRCRSR